MERSGRRAFLRRCAQGVFALAAGTAAGGALARESRALEAPLAARFLTNAHNAFDFPAGLAAYADRDVSHLEADLQYVAGDRFVSAHRLEEVGPDSLALPQIFEHLRAHRKAGLFDLKPSSCTVPLANRFLGQLARSGLDIDQCVVSTPDWELLEYIGRAEPRLLRLYSVPDRPRLDAFLARTARARPANAGVSIYKDLVTAGLVRQLHRYGLRVQPWPVATEAEVIRLLVCGVDGITSGRADMLARARAVRRFL